MIAVVVPAISAIVLMISKASFMDSHPLCVVVPPIIQPIMLNSNSIIRYVMVKMCYYDR